MILFKGSIEGRRFEGFRAKERKFLTAKLIDNQRKSRLCSLDSTESDCLASVVGAS